MASVSTSSAAGSVAGDPEALPVLTERRGPAGEILVVTINRPHARNAVTRAVSEGIAAAMDELDGAEEIRAAILTGAEGTFCAGMDLKAFVRGEDPNIPGRGFAGLAFSPPNKPLIAAVEGWALAGGCEIVLSCDLVIAAGYAAICKAAESRGLDRAAAGQRRRPLS
jgi:enoyl-CoA hydratase